MSAARRFVSTERAAPLVLALAIFGYIAVFCAAAFYKYRTFLVGFDLGVHEQVLWNTMHGRIAATSAFAATDSYFGIDIIPTELLLTPLYALFPSIYTMLALQTVALGLGALPVYLLVRDRWRSQWAGVVFALAFLLYLPVEYMDLYEFQIRALATTLLLWALYAMERRRVWLFLACTILALGCRSEAGLVVAGMGVAFWLEHRRVVNRGDLARFALLPVLLGLTYFIVCLQVLVPYFRNGQPSLYLDTLFGSVDGHPWLGSTLGEIFRTLLTRPGFVLTEVFGGAKGRGAYRIGYLVEMFLPFGFMLLLQPRMLLVTLPIFAINLLSNTPNIHASTDKHYQALIIPFIVVGSAYGLHWLVERVNLPRARQWALGGALLLALACNLGFQNPFQSLVNRALKGEVDTARFDAIGRLLAQVPPDAALTTTSLIGPHASRREQLYFFPGNVIYPADKVTRGEYLLIDSTLGEIRPEGVALLAEFERTGAYTRIAEDHGVTLWRKRP